MTDGRSRGMISLLYFASLRERLDCAREDFALPPGTPTVGTVVDRLRSRDGRWSEAFAPGRAWAGGRQPAHGRSRHAVEPGDEVAFFPPVTGG